MKTRSIPTTLVPGDGIGPEIVESVVAILAAAKAPFAWDRQQGGLAALRRRGDPLPPALLDSVRTTRLALTRMRRTTSLSSSMGITSRRRTGRRPRWVIMLTQGCMSRIGSTSGPCTYQHPACVR
jgi:isocitrate/isopropylmalate dehydrogenase